MLKAGVSRLDKGGDIFTELLFVPEVPDDGNYNLKRARFGIIDNHEKILRENHLHNFTFLNRPISIIIY